ncbi:MAG TPA: hypothetical protein VMV86_05645, partial [Methanosarcinales archaeon]|nr:hypothetical protein [Methanosarcinales archaeon]
KFMVLYGHILKNLVDETGRAAELTTFTSAPWVEGELTDKAKVTTTEYGTDDSIVVREFYEKVFTTMYGVLNPETGLVEYLFEENLDESTLPLLANPVQQMPDIYIKKSLLFGDYLVHEEMIPITEYPVQVTFFEWGGRPYRSYGMIYFVRDMQEAFDKMMQTMLLNGILQNNAGWIGPKGSIALEDKHKWEDHGNNPRVYKEYVPKVVGDKVLIPTKETVGILGSFYPMVLDMLKNGIEYSTGITAILQGNAKEAGIDVFSSLQQYQNAAMMRVQLATTHVNQMLSRLGNVLVEYLTSNITPGDYFFFDDKGKLNEMRIAQDIINDMRLYNYLTLVIPAQATQSQRLSSAQELYKIAQASPDPVERSVLAMKAMELSDIREFEEVRDEISLLQRTTSELNSQKEAYERLMETSKQMENKYINSELQNRILKSIMNEEKALAGAYADVKADLKKKKEKINQVEKKT